MKKSLLTLALVALATIGAKAGTAADIAGTYTVTFYGDQYGFYNYDAYWMDYFEFSEEEGNEYTVTVTAVDDNTVKIDNLLGISETYDGTPISDCVLVGAYDSEAGTITFPVFEFGLYYPYPDDYPDYCYNKFTFCAWNSLFDSWGLPDELEVVVATVDGDTITFDEFGVIDTTYIDFGMSMPYVWGESYTMVKSGSSAIASAAVDKVVDNRIYNLQGIEVSSEYKGLVIKNGKKYVQR